MIKWVHTKVSQMKIIKAYGIHLVKCMQVPQLVFFLLQIVRHFQKKYRVILNYQMDLFLWIKFVFFNTMTPDLSKKNESLFSSPLWYILLGWVCIFRKEFLKNSWQFWYHLLLLTIRLGKRQGIIWSTQIILAKQNKWQQNFQGSLYWKVDYIRNSQGILVKI